MRTSPPGEDGAAAEVEAGGAGGAGEGGEAGEAGAGAELHETFHQSRETVIRLKTVSSLK